ESQTSARPHFHAIDRTGIVTVYPHIYPGSTSSHPPLIDGIPCSEAPSLSPPSLSLCLCSPRSPKLRFPTPAPSQPARTPSRLSPDRLPRPIMKARKSSSSPASAARLPTHLAACRYSTRPS